MTIPFVIDNQQHKMASVLNDLLARHKGHSLDVATAYFNVGGWQLLRGWWRFAALAPCRFAQAPPQTSQRS